MICAAARRLVMSNSAFEQIRQAQQVLLAKRLVSAEQAVALARSDHRIGIRRSSLRSNLIFFSFFFSDQDHFRISHLIRLFCASRMPCIGIACNQLRKRFVGHLHAFGGHDGTQLIGVAAVEIIPQLSWACEREG